MILKRNEDSSKIEDLMISILDDIMQYGPVYPEQLETLSYIKKLYPEIFSSHERALVYRLGLFYKIGDPESLTEYVLKMQSDYIKERTNHTFTAIQYDELSKINSHRIFSLSAPTSSGKSYLMRTIISECDNDVVIVLPSRALIAEYIISLSQTLPKDVLLLQFVDVVNRAKVIRRVFVITPERGEDLIHRASDLNVGMIIFDEAQMADDNDRGFIFDSLVRRCDETFQDAKMIFIHPFIDNPKAQIERNLLKQSEASDKKYNQESVGKIFITRSSIGRFHYFSPYINENKKPQEECEDIISHKLKDNGTVLIYISKQSIYNQSFYRKYNFYISQCEPVTDSDALELIEKLKTFIGAATVGNKSSFMLGLMKKGVVLHHGSLPLQARKIIEDFINKGYAKICFSTSTLIQGINMPFDVVYIDFFKFNGKTEDKKRLELKNLIGRAGRTTNRNDCFDFGYVIINKCNLELFRNRLIGKSELAIRSVLDASFDGKDEDMNELIEAYRDKKFDYELKLPSPAKDRIEQRIININLNRLLDMLLKDNIILSGDEYIALKDSEKKFIKNTFESIYCAHLKRDCLTQGEKSVLSTAISIILWRIQGKSFKEIVSLRMSYVLRKENLYTAKAKHLPNAEFKYAKNLFESDSFNYDMLVYDTYDYLDKVVNFSIANPICAVLKIYFDSSNDKRALSLMNYIRYGTDNPNEILFLRYGFSIDEFKLLHKVVQNISEDEIIFNDEINNLSDTDRLLLSRYI